jgi:hypothetical protein
LLLVEEELVDKLLELLQVEVVELVVLDLFHVFQFVEQLVIH